uniref:hypothetical protein n=1 Tax=Escherichia coli TaxID=562 RepID=UPI00157A60E1
MSVQQIDWDLALIQKYNYSGPRYTSYPTALEFSEDFGEQRCTMDDFLLQRVQILIGLVLLASNNLIATAEVTKLMAER